MTSTTIQGAIRLQIEAIRTDNEDIIAEQPDHAETPSQHDLVKKHGTPRQMAQAFVNAIGEISCLECHNAIRSFRERWDAAGPQTSAVA